MFEPAERTVLKQKLILLVRHSPKQVHRFARNALDVGDEHPRVERRSTRMVEVGDAVWDPVYFELPTAEATDEHRRIEERLSSGCEELAFDWPTRQSGGDIPPDRQRECQPYGRALRAHDVQEGVRPPDE